MNRHIILGFKKGSSFKNEAGELVGLASSLPEAIELANKNTGAKKFAYCGIVQAKMLCKIIGDRSKEDTNIITFAKPKKVKPEKKSE